MSGIVEAKRKLDTGSSKPSHSFDEDGVCTRCGFDGAEFVWWKGTAEGRAFPEARMPACKEAVNEHA